MFKEISIGGLVYRFYKTDHVWTCTVVESQLNETIAQLRIKETPPVGGTENE